MSLEALAEELTFQQILLNTLRPVDEEYEQDKAQIEKTISELQKQIDLLTLSRTPSRASPGVSNGAAQARKRARDNEGPPSTSHPLKLRRTTDLPSSSISDDSDLEAIDADIFALLSGKSSSQAAQDAIEKRRQRELDLQKQREQMWQDELLARQLSQPSKTGLDSTSHRPFGNFGPNMAQRNLNANGTLRSVKKQALAGSQQHFKLQSPDKEHKAGILAPNIQVKPQAESPHAPSDGVQYDLIRQERGLPQRYGYANTGESAPILRQQSVSMNPIQPQQFEFPNSFKREASIASIPGYYNITDDDEGSDSSLQEIDASMFRAKHPKSAVSPNPPPHTAAAAAAKYPNPIVIDDDPFTAPRVLPWQHPDYLFPREMNGAQLPGRYGANQYSSGFAYGHLRQTTALVGSARQPFNQRAMPVMEPVDHAHSYLFADSSRSEDDIKKLLENIRPDQELPPELRKGTPADMYTTLLEHQKLGLSWLVEMEEKMKGGILADDMGLGKTIQAIALMVSRRSQDARQKTNLIIAPVALLRQWEAEIVDKIHKRCAMSVFRYHGASKRIGFQQLRNYDVVLTTYGTLMSEYRQLAEWKERKRANPDAKAPSLAILGSECKWYRTILDEAQNIKNKKALCSLGAHAIDSTYRLCMTGTPMMNSVDELYPLLRFCRVKPYNDWDRFNSGICSRIKSSSDAGQASGMRQLQTLLRAVMLRRTKKSKLDGKPLITLPPRHQENREVQFDDEQRQFYSDLETKAQATIKNMISKGTLGKKYSCALVLLLRLRQACNHQHLVFFSESASTMSRLDMSAETMHDLAKELSPDVVSRVIAEEGMFDCPICLDGTENPAILLPCGHCVCTDCFVSLKDNANITMEGASMKCPVCRGPVNPTKGYTDYQAFKEVHQPELLDEQEREKARQLGLDLDGQNSDSDISEDDDEDDENYNDNDDEVDEEDETLGGFIVPDNDADAGSNLERSANADADSVQKNQAKRKKKKKKKNLMKSFVLRRGEGPKGKAKGKAKGKEKAVEKQKFKHKSLAELKKEGLRSQAAQKLYYKRLSKWYTPSAKITQTIELLTQISIEKPGEKSLVFSQFTSYLDLLEVGLQRKQRWTVERYDGGMSAEARAAAIDRFRTDASITVMLISLKAGNAGLNLNFASQVIIEDPFYNPYVMEQAVDRAHRIGQRHEVCIYYIVVPNTVEDRILQLCQQKRDLIEKALDEKEGRNVGRLGTKELAFLFGLDAGGHVLPSGSKPPGHMESDTAKQGGHRGLQWPGSSTPPNRLSTGPSQQPASWMTMAHRLPGAAAKRDLTPNNMAAMGWHV